MEDNAVYLPLEYFKSTSYYVQDPMYIRDYTNTINKFLTERGEEPVSFYGVKKANIKNVPDTMQSFDDYVEEFKSLVMTRYAEEYNNWNTYYNLEGRWKALFFANKDSFPEDIKNQLQKIHEDFNNLEKFTSLWYALRFDISEKPFDIKEEYIKKFPLLVPAINGNISLMADIIGKEL